ncbi:MAG: hypothetical protein HN341_00140, partial [Verrucomicrobia bacterium]|nr:hypothetical protein [Verrucomicrobiota bacterium]
MSESESTNLLQNKHTKIEWKAKEDALSIVDLESGLEIMDPSTGRDPATDGLWQIDLENEIIRPSQAKRRKSSVDENMLALTWTDFNFVSAPRFSVTAAVTLASDGFSRWELSFVGAARDWQISGVRYPRLTGLSRLGEQEWLALPYMLGMLVENPHANLKDLRDNTIGTTAVTGAARTKESITSRWQSWYPGQLSMQCSALYGSSGRGFYIAAEDSEAHLKSLAWQHSGENRLDVEFLSYPSLPLSDGRYELPYPVVTGVFKGDWISAAKIYRTWAIKQKWYENSRYRRSLSADWLRETGLWMWNRSYAENIIVPAATLRDFAGVRVSVLWHWWHGCAYDTGFPEYLPPRGGNGKFRDALVSLAREGIQPIVYVNGRLWGTSTQSWQDEGALAGAAQAADGGTYAEVYNTFNRLPCAPMCPQHKVWQNKISALFVEILQDYNLPGIYMDQVAIAEPARCHNPNHGHDLPGGNGWAAGYHDLMAKMREKVDGDRMVATEGCCEVYMDSYDAFLTLDASVERFNAGVASNPYCLPIPFFPAVYHG